MAKNNKVAKPKAMTKSAVYQAVADETGLSRKQVSSVFDALGDAIKKELKKDGDVFTIPGLARLKLVKKKAVKGGKQVPNPFKPGEMMLTKDKPARNVVRLRPLKGLNDMVK